MTDPCTYCGSDVEAHDPVYVETAGEVGHEEVDREEADREEAGREEVGQFCNYACLSAWIDAENLTEGDACEWSP